MESLISSFQGVVSYIVPMVVLLGLLIFVHELGHFLVAKYFKVRVEVFSLGFGPKILKFKRGDTVYAISAFPLGGYVKMFGDDPTATDIDPAQKAYSFTHKPVGQRIAVVLAGPLMNFFFAIVVFAGVAALGEQALAPVLGDVNETSAAYVAGFRSGDKVVAAGGAPVMSWDDLQKSIEASADSPLSVSVDRSGAPVEVKVTPKLVANKNVMSWDRAVGEIEGLTYSSRSSFIGVKDPKSPAGLAGLAVGDSIKSVNGVGLTKWRELREALVAAAANSEKISLQIERGLLDEKTAEKPTVITAEIVVPSSAKGKNAEEVMTAIGIEYPEMYLAGIEKGSPAAKAGLEKGDRLVSIDGQAVGSFDQVVSAIRSYGEQKDKVESATPQEPHTFELIILRGGEEKKVALAPNMRERMNAQGKEEKRFEIGIRPLIVDALPATIEVKSDGPVAALSRGFDQTIKWTNLTVLSFVRLFQSEVSPKNIGGFLSIGQMAKKSWQIGAAPFLNIMAIISINLFILNLLPVPVLDGGHLVFYTIEAIKGAPLSMRKMEIAQQVGMVLLLGLMVFALFNDVTRIIFN